jgi:DNA-binding MarR family transcriptional regulator
MSHPACLIGLLDAFLTRFSAGAGDGGVVTVDALRAFLVVAQRSFDPDKHVSVSQLSRALNVPLPKASRLLRTLGTAGDRPLGVNGLGLIEARRDRSAYRIKRHALSPAGRKLLSHAVGISAP